MTAGIRSIALVHTKSVGRRFPLAFVGMYDSILPLHFIPLNKRGALFFLPHNDDIPCPRDPEIDSRLRSIM